MRKDFNPHFSLGFYFPYGIYIFGTLGIVLCIYFMLTSQWIAIIPIAMLTLGLAFLKSTISINLQKHEIEKSLMLGGFPIKREFRHFSNLEKPCTKHCRFLSKGHKTLKPETHRGYVLVDGQPLLLFETKDKRSAEQQIEMLKSELNSIDILN